MISINGKLLLEPYVSSGAIKAEIKSGFATVKQKSTLIGLKALHPSKWIDKNGHARSVNRGDTVFLKEEDLHTQAFAKTVFNLDSDQEKFIIVDANSAISISRAE